jgi:hypothetical protein
MAGIAILLALFCVGALARTQSSTYSVSGTPAFLQVGRCYVLTFPIVGAPNWKVVEVLDAGWFKAENDASPASARREPVWINTGQIVTVREARCSD